MSSVLKNAGFCFKGDSSGLDRVRRKQGSASCNQEEERNVESGRLPSSWDVHQPAFQTTFSSKKHSVREKLRSSSPKNMVLSSSQAIGQPVTLLPYLTTVGRRREAQEKKERCYNKHAAWWRYPFISTQTCPPCTDVGKTKTADKLLARLRGCVSDRSVHARDEVYESLLPHEVRTDG
jgi:hypothetical protein